tara:strand:+ start:50 stop:538 length:489 start_codon:yes stop_codon:yes gene_type:complete
MPDTQEQTLNRPIPGQSLTAEVGSRPWQSPPQFNNVEEAMGWYLDRFDNNEVVQELLSVMEMGVPLSTIANSMQLGAVLQGIHSIDVGMLMIPVLIEIMKHLAEKTDTKYVMGDEPEESDRPSDSVIQSAINSLEEGEEVDMDEETVKEEEEEPMGLMARRA